MAPTTDRLRISDVRGSLNALVNDVYHRERRILVEKSGIPVAGIVSPQDIATLERLDAERADRFRVLDEIREIFKDVPPEELEAEALKAVEAIRTERRNDESTSQ